MWRIRGSWVVGAVALVALSVLLALLLRRPTPYDHIAIPSKRPLIQRQAVRSVTCHLRQRRAAARGGPTYLLDIGGFRAVCADLAQEQGQQRIQFLADVHDVAARFGQHAPTVDWTADAPFVQAITQTFLCAFVDPDTHRLELTADAPAPLGALVRGAPPDVPRGAVQLDGEGQLARLELAGAALEASSTDRPRWMLAKVALGSMLGHVLRTWSVVLRALLREVCATCAGTLGYCHPLNRLLAPLCAAPNPALPDEALFAAEVAAVRPWLWARLYGRITERWDPRWGAGLPQIQPALERFALRVLQPAYGRNAAVREDRELRAWTRELGVAPASSIPALAALTATCHLLHLATRTALEGLRLGVGTPLMPAFLVPRATVHGEEQTLAEFLARDREDLSIQVALEAFLPLPDSLVPQCVHAFALLREAQDFEVTQLAQALAGHFATERLAEDIRNVQRDLRVREALRE